MRNEKLLAQHQVSSPLSLSSEERYELIAQAALQLQQRKLQVFSGGENGDSEHKKLWDSNDIEIDFSEVISFYD